MSHSHLVRAKPQQKCILSSVQRLVHDFPCKRTRSRARRTLLRKPKATCAFPVRISCSRSCVPFALIHHKRSTCQGSEFSWAWCWTRGVRHKRKSRTLSQKSIWKSLDIFRNQVEMNQLKGNQKSEVSRAAHSQAHGNNWNQ